MQPIERAEGEWQVGGFECMPFFVIVIFAASDHWSGSYISQTKYTANGLAEGGLLASGQPLLSDRTLTHLTRSLLFRRWAPLIVRNLKILFEFPG